jgi:hypothetical protein
MNQLNADTVRISDQSHNCLPAFNSSVSRLELGLHAFCHEVGKRLSRIHDLPCQLVNLAFSAVGAGTLAPSSAAARSHTFPYRKPSLRPFSWLRSPPNIS